MDLLSAYSEPFFRLNRDHGRQGSALVLTALGHELVAKEIEAGTSRDQLGSRVQLWGGMPDWSEPRKLLTLAQADVGGAGVVRAFSSFDVFLGEVQQDLDVWSSQCRRLNITATSTPSAAPPSSGDAPATDLEDRGLRLYDRLGWSFAEVHYLMPVYRIYRAIRNSVAHNAARATTELVAASSRRLWDTAAAEWKKATGETLTRVVEDIALGAEAHVTYREAILTLSLLRRLALDINRHLLSSIGTLGVVYFAARRTLVENPPSVRTHKANSSLGLLHDVMTSRYRIDALDESETARLFRELSIRDTCEAGFARLIATGFPERPLKAW